MKTYAVVLSLFVVVSAVNEKEQQFSNHLKCNLESKPSEGEILPTTDWIDIKDECVNLARKQIRMEFEAALAYFQLGAYFSQYDTNRPGFAKFFFDASTEERSHAIKVFDYLLMRGQLTTYHPDPQLHTLLMGTSTNKSTELSKLSEALKKKEVKGGLDALNMALKYEVAVTRSIKRMIKACENEEVLSESDKLSLEKDEARVAPNDYHMVDWLITDLLDEQLRGQRELAGRISTLYKMKEGYGVIADFLYDKKLLEELNSKAA
ncbi:Ferritin-like domain [Nesidiocoris tenuis]|nr:Ferritin-like domain [Nesidiocoris tenuis]